MTMDLDSTVCEVHGHHKQGAAYGNTHILGYHPLLVTRADWCTRSKVLSDRHWPISWGLGVIPRQPSRSVSAVSARLVSKP
jgi:hypothetical protein